MAKVQEFNRKHPAETLNCNVIPIPYIGNPLASVVLIGNIAGGSSDEENHQARPAYTERLRKNLLHDIQDWPFFPLDPGFEAIAGHKEKWWTPRLQYLLDALDERGIANPPLALSQALFAVEYFPYRSSSDRYVSGTPALALSQRYSFWLVRQAMKRDALIVVRFGKDRWFEAVDGLSAYSGLLLLRGVQQVHLSPKGFHNIDGFKRVVAKIVSSWPSAEG
jgi:hypothetical protein